MFHATRFVTVPRICALLATVMLASLTGSAEAAATQVGHTSIIGAQPTSSLQTSKSRSSPSKSTKSTKSTSKSTKSTPAKSHAKSGTAKQKTTVCCTGCDACRKRAAKNGVKVR